jgi:hypothetical protein
MRRSLVVAALAAVLLMPVVARAHGGHVHKVMGTVSAVAPTQLEVKTTDGKVAVVLLDAKTVYEQGTAKVDLRMLKVGDRVVVEGTQATGAKNVTAQKVRIGAAPAAPAKNQAAAAKK